MRAGYEQRSRSNSSAFPRRGRPGSSPDLNPAEHIGAIIKDGVEDHLRRGGDHSQAALCQAIDAVLTGMRGNAELFELLLCSYPARIKAVLEGNGGPTDY